MAIFKQISFYFMIFFFCLTTNAFADFTFNAGSTEVCVYGIFELNNFYKHTKAAEGDDDTDILFTMATTSRAGFTAKNGDFSGTIEAGLDHSNVYTRLFYATWENSLGTLTIGKNYTPYTWGTWEVADDLQNFSGHGSLFDWRQPLLTLKFNNGFYISAIKPEDNGVTGAADAEVDNIVPKLAVGFDHWGDKFSYGIGIAYQTYQEEAASLGFDDRVNSGFLYFHGGYQLTEAAKLSYNLHYGQNLNEFGCFKATHQAADISTGSVEDTTAYGGFIEGSYALKDKYCTVLNAAVGYTVGDNDLWDNKDDKLGAYLDAYVTLTPHITLIPEISVTDNLDDRYGEEEDDIYFAGAMWRISF